MKASLTGRCFWIVGFFIMATCSLPILGQSQIESGRLSASVLTNLARGISLRELAEKTKIKPVHQFTARLGTNDFLCVSFSFQQPRGALFFLFSNGKLASIQERPRVEFETKTYRGTPAQVPKPVDSEQRMNKIIQTADLSASEIAEKVMLWSSYEASASKGTEPENILPVLIITAPLETVQIPAKRRAEAEAAELAKQFDPFKIKLGMTAAEVQTLFGAPALQHHESTNCQLRVYGSKLPLHLTVETPLVWVSIMFCDGAVTRIFSHSLFDKRLIQEK